MLPSQSYRYEFWYDVGGGTYEKIDVETKNFKVVAEIDKDSKPYVEATGSAGNCVYVKTKDTFVVDMDDPAYIDVEFTLIARRDIYKKGESKADGNAPIIYRNDEFYFYVSEDFGNDIVYVEVEEEDPDNANMYNATVDKTSFSSDGERGWVAFDCGDIDILMLMPKNSSVCFGYNDNEIEAVEKLSTAGSLEFVNFEAQHF